MEDSNSVWSNKLHSLHCYKRLHCAVNVLHKCLNVGEKVGILVLKDPDMKSLQLVIKLDQNIIDTHLLSISDID